MDLASAKRISDFTLDSIRKGRVKSAHDCSEAAWLWRSRNVV